MTTLADLQSNRRGKPARRPVETRTCPECGAQFQTWTREGQKRPKIYCDYVCSSKATGRKQRARIRAEREAQKREAAVVALANEVLG